MMGLLVSLELHIDAVENLVSMTELSLVWGGRKEEVTYTGSSRCKCRWYTALLSLSGISRVVS